MADKKPDGLKIGDLPEVDAAIGHEVTHGFGLTGLVLGIASIRALIRLGAEEEMLLDVIGRSRGMLDALEKAGDVTRTAASAARHQLDRAVADALQIRQASRSPKQ